MAEKRKAVRRREQPRAKKPTARAAARSDARRAGATGRRDAQPESRPHRATAAEARAAATRAAAARTAAAAFVDEHADPAEIAAQQNWTAPPYTVVGIGASAGGLEACSQLLDAIKPGAGLALVVVQHLSPRHESSLPGLLRSHTRLTVVQASEALRIEPDHVYVIPPDAQMGVVDGQLHLMPRPSGRSQHTPIDVFFRSLAENAQSRAIVVILSGTGSDGAVGLRDVKAAGGIVIAQEPRSAKYDGMPRAAVNTGMVDLVLPPQDIAVELMRIGRQHHAETRAPHATPEALEPHDDKLKQIFHLLRTSSGVDFTHYKLPTIRRRLNRRMVLNKVSSVEEYIEFLNRHAGEVTALYQDILIHVTRFFRDPESFEVLKRNVFPRLLDHRMGKQPLRIWVPGCATGEEAYSIAIALLEFLGEETHSVPIQIFATDVSERALDHARAGAYPESIAADVSPERLRRFFTRSDGHHRIQKSIRDLCIFARQDLTRDPPFSKLDLIVCRNVLIYLGPALQKRLMSIFHYALRPHGFLMLGAAETVGPHTDLFGLTDKKHKLYTKKYAMVPAETDFRAGAATSRRGAAGVDIAFRPIGESRGGAGAGGVGAGGAAGGPQNQALPTLLNEANRVLLNRFSPPGVIVDSDLHIIQFRGQTGMYLEPAPGEASLNLLKMAREGLLYGLRTAMHEARKTESPVRREGQHVKYNGSVREVNLEVIPLTKLPDGRYFLILFEDVTPHAAAAAPPEKRKAKRKDRAGAAHERQMTRLQQELAANRDYLQSIIQDLEAANEELQSANEEILSSNEELQSTNEELDTAKEELQSGNEELNTVNEELQARNEELSRVNSDLINLLGSVNIAIVMVAADLRIRRFTPTAERVLNLIPSDVGRPISDLKPNIDCPDLEQLIAESVDTVAIKERSVQDRRGNQYLLRVRPYKNIDNRIDGAVLVLFDDTETQRALGAARTDAMDSELARLELQAILDTVRHPLAVLDDDLTLRSGNRQFFELFRLHPSQAIGQRIEVLDEARWAAPALRELLEHVLPQRGEFDDYELVTDVPMLGRRRLLLTGRRIAPEPGRPPLILLAIELAPVQPPDDGGAVATEARAELQAEPRGGSQEPAGGDGNGNQENR